MSKLVAAFSSYKKKSYSFINPFVSIAPFSPPENIRKPLGFIMFSGSRESVPWQQMGLFDSNTITSIWSTIKAHVKVCNKTSVTY